MQNILVIIYNRFIMKTIGTLILAKFIKKLLIFFFLYFWILSKDISFNT